MPENKFIVRESVFFNLLLGLICLSIFIGVIFTIKGQQRFTTLDYIKFVALLFIPSIIVFRKATRRSLVFQIDKNGIYYIGVLITNWDRFIQAYVLEDNPEKGLDIRFSLYVEYYDLETNVPFKIKIPLSGTLDKSTEQIEFAIKEYSLTSR
ncbi:MAG: hypothetical protein WKF35_09575 [Ferruginibacter sp.]